MVFTKRWMPTLASSVVCLLLLYIQNATSLSRPGLSNDRSSRRTASSDNTKRNGAAPRRIARTRNNNKAHIRASKTTIQSVKTPPTNNDADSLTNYMQLPASQYTCVPMPLDSSLSRRNNEAVDEFELIVPPIQLKSPGVPMVEVRPIISARVLVEQNRVVITSNSCEIRGSKIIQDLKINDYFEFQVQICMTYKDGSSNNGSSSIMAKSEIKVDLDPPGVFGLVPRSILEVVGNSAIGLTLEALQRDFMRSLGKDYERWSCDKPYRMQREQQQLKMEFQQQQQNTADNNNIHDTLMTYLVNR